MAELREVFAHVGPYIRDGVKQFIDGTIENIEYLAGLADASEDPAGITAKLESEYQVELHVQDRIVIRQRLVRIVANKLAEKADVDPFAGVMERSARNSHYWFNMQFVWDNMVMETFEQIADLVEGGAMQGEWLSRQISGYANWIAGHINESLETWVTEFTDEVMGESWADDPGNPLAELDELDRDQRGDVERMINDSVRRQLIPKLWRHFHLFSDPQQTWRVVHREKFEERSVPRDMLQTFEPDLIHPDAGRDEHKKKKDKRPKMRARSQ